MVPVAGSDPPLGLEKKWRHIRHDKFDNLGTCRYIKEIYICTKVFHNIYVHMCIYIYTDALCIYIYIFSIYIYILYISISYCTDTVISFSYIFLT